MLLQIEDVVVPNWCLKIKTSFFFKKIDFLKCMKSTFCHNSVAQNIERLDSENIVNSEALKTRFCKQSWTKYSKEILKIR